MSGLIGRMFPNVKQVHIHVLTISVMGIGTLAAVTILAAAILTWWPQSCVYPYEEVTITEPKDKVVLTASSGSWRFSAKGIARRRHAEKYLYLVVQVPGSNDYYYSEMVGVGDNGDWGGWFYVGSEEFPPKKGDQLRLTAVITTQQLPAEDGKKGFPSLNSVPGKVAYSSMVQVTVSNDP
ncbi:MAG: hypothetical protein AB1646_01540 [Thermodesulfobacteriota bacterium]